MKLFTIAGEPPSQKIPPPGAVHSKRGAFSVMMLFEIVEYHRTFGVLSPQVKACLSHRARAARQLIPRLVELIVAGEWETSPSR